MKRRKFISGVVGGGMAGLVGCLGAVDSSPEPEFQEFIVPDPRGVQINREENEYTGTIHNRRGEGEVVIELWYLRDSTVPEPDVQHDYQLSPVSGREFVTARSEYFTKDERRDVSIKASNDMPDDWSYYGMYPWAAEHGALFKNTGGTGEVEARLEFRDTQGFNLDTPTPVLDSVSSDETLHVSFHILIPPQVEYEIVAEPA